MGHSQGDRGSPSVAQNNLVEDILAGLSAGIVGTVIGYPLDLVKTRMQVSSKQHQHGVTLFKTSAQIFRNEGITGFFKGLMTPLVSLSPISSLSFASYSWCRHQIGAERGWDVLNAVAASACGAVTSPVTTMESVVRTQMQVDNINKKQYRGSYHCVTFIAQKHGIPALFTGIVVTAARDVAYLCTYFYIYEGLKATLTGEGFKNEYLSVRTEVAVPLAGGTSGAIAWFISFPIDCVRAGVQGQSLERDINNPQKNGRQIFKKLIETTGFRALYRGVTPTIIRAFIVSSSRFSAYESTLWAIRKYSRTYDGD